MTDLRLGDSFGQKDARNIGTPNPIQLQRSWLEDDGSTQVVVNNTTFTVNVIQQGGNGSIEVTRSSSRAKLSPAVIAAIKTNLSAFAGVLIPGLEYAVVDRRK